MAERFPCPRCGRDKYKTSNDLSQHMRFCRATPEMERDVERAEREWTDADN